MVKSWKRSLTVAVVLALLLSPLLSAVQQCLASPGVTVELSQSSGPIGITVTVSGQLENPGAEFKVFWQYIKEWDGRYGLLASGYAEGYNYVVNITIPPATRGEHYVIVEDEKNHATGYASFTVYPEITVQPDTAPSGAVVSVSGRLINNETVDIMFYDPEDGEVLVAQALTDAATGAFSCSFRVPLKPEGGYSVRAYWNGALQAEAPFHIGHVGMSVKPDKAPPKAVVNVSGGLVLNKTLIIAFSNSTWRVNVATVQSDQSGQFSANVTVPEASPGNYNVEALSPADSSLIASAPFTVLPPAQITVSSDAVRTDEAVSGYSTLTVHGSNFIANETVAVYFENDPIKVAETTVDSTGGFTASFIVPANASAGLHTVVAIQSPYNVSSSANITIHTAAVIRPYSILYTPGDTICFDVNSTTPFSSGTHLTIIVLDPRGVRFSQLQIDPALLSEVRGCWTVPYDVATLWPEVPEGAVAGVWTWNATYGLDLYPGVQFNASGVFYVVPEPDLNYILARLDSIEAKISGIAYKEDQLYLLIETDHNYVMARLEQLEATLFNITYSGFAYVQTALGIIQLKLDDLHMVVDEVKGDAVTIQTALGAVKANLTSLMAFLENANATVTDLIVNSEGEMLAAIQAGNASLMARLDALGASIASVQNGTVTITTEIGNVMASLKQLGANVTQLILDLKGEATVQIQTLLGVVNATLESLGGKITAIHGNVADVLIPGLGEVKALVTGARETSEGAAQTVSSMSTLMYAVLILSIVAAALSTACFLRLKRKTASS